jgi:hypothetical protein
MYYTVLHIHDSNCHNKRALCWHYTYTHKPQTIYAHCFQHLKLSKPSDDAIKLYVLWWNCQGYHSLPCHIAKRMSSIFFRECHLWIHNKVTTQGWCAGNMPDMYLRCQIRILAGKATVHGFFLSIQRNTSVIPILGNSCLLPYHFQFNIGHSAVLRAHKINLKKKVCHGTITESDRRHHN